MGSFSRPRFPVSPRSVPRILTHDIDALTADLGAEHVHLHELLSIVGRADLDRLVRAVRIDDDPCVTRVEREGGERTKGAHQLKMGGSWALYKKVQDLFGNTVHRRTEDSQIRPMHSGRKIKHRLVNRAHGESANAGPNLKGRGSPDWVADVIADAGDDRLFGKKNKMPRFADKLTRAEIEQLAKLVLSQKDK